MRVARPADGVLAMKSKSFLVNARRCALERGFSLVELMVTVAVLSLLMTLAVPSFNEWIQNGRIRTAAESIQNGLQVARAEAVRRNARVEFALVSTVPEDATSVAFDGLGRSDNTLTAINVDVPTSALPAAQSRDLRITIGTGGVRMCDPNVSDSTDPRKC